ncbi:MAG: N-formylglutamate amidohydrolase [Maribacter sp.]|jgi:N-formylglutamate amidohydrolase
MKKKVPPFFSSFYLLFIILILVSCGGSDAPEIETPVRLNAEEYVHFEAGNIPLILSVPHGGELKPSKITNRTCNDAVSVMDEFTIELSQAIMAEFAKVGQKPYLIVNKMHRSKMDANRNRVDATCGDTNAQAVWDLFHGQIETSRTEVKAKFQKGLFIDLHGHGNPKQRVELGYLLFEDELALPNETLNSPALLEVSSIQNLARNNLSGVVHTELLKGDNAFGSLLDQTGFAAVPSSADQVPLAPDNYFSGGYNTANYSSYKGGSIDGIQVECNRAGLRDTAANRQAFAVGFESAVTAYLETHYFNEIPVQE